MTVLIGFASPASRTSFLGSDDVEFHSRRTVDKVAIVLGRFLVGALGNDSAFDAVDTIARLGAVPTELRQGDSYLTPASIEDLCQAAAEVLALIVPLRIHDLDRAVALFVISDDQRAHLCKQPMQLVIIDASASRLVLANFGEMSLLRTTFRPILDELLSNTCYRFGINEPRELGLISPSILRDPASWCATQIDAAKAYLRSLECDVPIGALGAWAFAGKRKFRFRSAYRSLTELAGHYHPPVLPRPAVAAPEKAIT